MPLLDTVRTLSLVEQALISGANFLALVWLARRFDGAAFGVFSFAMLTLLFVVNLHRSAVVVPFVIHAADRAALPAEAANWRLLNLSTALLAAGALALVAACLPLFAAPAWMPRAFVVAALFVPPAFSYEFRRRWLIQLDRYGGAVAAAGLYAAVHLAGVFAAIMLRNITLAMAGFALANLAAAGLCIALAPRLAAPKAVPPFRPFMARLAHFIGWSVMSNVAYNFYYHLPPLILGAMAGPVPVAVFQAMRSFIQPLVTLTTAMDNFDKPRAARAMAEHGVPGMWRSLTQTTLAMAVLHLPYLAVMVGWGGTLEHMVYGGRYGDARTVLWWFAALQAAVLAAYPLETALFLLRRPDLLFRGRVAAAATGVAMSLALIPHWGVGGAMAATVAGLAVSAVAALLLLPR